ncbi:hypothetical protein AB0J42_35440 [Nonomuraea sp. NPDC049649]|uniref:hypothetical protein n=1 Tax=Nonomuraea sp. NPDC049649 TaxID=3155776 RepID=UPI00342D718F
MTFPETFHDPHVVSIAAEDVAWRKPTPRSSRVRVRRHSGHYDLCQAGGLWFIRRTVRDAGPAVVSETIEMSSVEAELLWTRLLGN